MSMFRPEIIASAVALALVGAPRAYADPLPFTGPWQVGPSSGATGNGTFGLLDVNSPIGNAVAKASNPFFPLLGLASSSATIQFIRPFALAPGPTYTLFLNASLSGTLSTLFATDSAGVMADALIQGAGNGPIVLSLTAGIFSITGPSTTLPVDTGVVKASTAAGAIPPGGYDIFATLSVFAVTTQNLLPELEAVADFFNSGFLVSGAVSAVAPPVPEPSSALLLATAALGLLSFTWRRQRA